MKNIVITGANSGIGFQTAKGLYADGHYIIFGSRNTAKNQQAANQIRQAHPNSKGKIQHLALDLARKASVEQFADFVKKEFKHVDILINNAGLISFQREVSELGVEKTYAINHFGHFYLTYLLFPLIKSSQEGRIINVSSALHLSAKQSIVNDPECNNGFSSFKAYEISKLANVMFTAQLAQKLTNNPKIKVFSLHPGVVETDFGRGSCLTSCFRIFCCCMFVDSERGATTSLFLARSEFGSLRSGEYYNDDTRWKEMNAIARNKVENQKLWQLSEKLYGVKFQV